MGQALARCAGDGFSVVGGSERPGAAGIGVDQGGWALSDSAQKAAASADVWIDFTTPDATLAALWEVSAMPASMAATVKVKVRIMATS